MTMIEVRHFKKTETLKNGIEATFRAVRPDDRQKIIDAFRNLERESIFMRFFGYKNRLSEAELKAAVDVDFVRVVTLVVTTKEEDHDIVIGGGRYSLLNSKSEEETRAEVSFTVEEDFHGQGIASRLLHYLAQVARERGVRTFLAEVLSENRAMLAVFEHSGFPLQQKKEGDIVHVTLSI
ncbi:MAG: GNAT family N-acetyltransferase [Desulfobacterales bacterium]